MKTTRTTALLGLLLSLLLPLWASADDLEVHVLGAGSERVKIPAFASNLFFGELAAARARIGSEIDAELDGINVLGIRLSELHPVAVDKNIYIVMVGTNTGFEVSGSGVGIDVDSNFTCPSNTKAVCKSIDLDVHVPTFYFDGAVDFFDGTAALTAEPSSVDVDIDVNYTAFGWLTSRLILALSGFQLDVDPYFERHLADHVLTVELEEMFSGLDDVIDQVPSGAFAALGVDPHAVLRNPVAGLMVDIDVIPPTASYLDNGLIRIVLSSPTPVPNASVYGGKPRLTWSAVPGAVRYRIYSRTESAGWRSRGSTTATSWIDTHYNPAPSTLLEADTPGGGDWLQYYLVAENALGIPSRNSMIARFAIIHLGGGGGGGGDDDGPVEPW